VQVLFFSVLLVKFSVEDGKSHWLSGVVLIGMSPSPHRRFPTTLNSGYITEWLRRWRTWRCDRVHRADCISFFVDSHILPHRPFVLEFPGDGADVAGAGACVYLNGRRALVYLGGYGG
jgi:hypothetical protein